MNAKNSETLEKLEICVVTFSFAKHDYLTKAQLNSFVNVLKPLVNRVNLITGDIPGDYFGEKVRVIPVTSPNKKNGIPMIRNLKHNVISSQLKIAEKLKIFLQSSPEVRVVLFFMMQSYAIPVWVARRLGRMCVLVATGSSTRNALANWRRRWYDPFGSFLLLVHWAGEKSNYRLCDRIVVECGGVIPFFGLEKHRPKVLPYGALPVDLSRLNSEKPLGERGNVVGYIGRLVPVKGVMNFVSAIPLIASERPDLRFIIGGEGVLIREIREELLNSGVGGRVEMPGRIPEDNFARYMNLLKLIVLPSYTEGLPLVPLEAMACGTPVLATGVGGVPDIIEDGKTGFILENSSPGCIAKSVLRALEHPRLQEIADNARRMVSETYTYEGAVRRYEAVLRRVADEN